MRLFRRLQADVGMSSRSVSLRTQLLVTIVGLIVATAVALTTLAYRAQVESLERSARRAVRAAAQSRADAIVRLIDGQQQRAQRFLVAAAALCGEQTPAGGTAWELGCARRALRELRVTERADGALLTYGRRRIARSGVPMSDELPVPTPLARLIEDEGPVTYVLRAENNETAVRLRFTLAEISALFDQPLGLGTGGEIFLRDFAGGFLTSPRFGGTTVPVASSEARHTCTPGPYEWVDIDYRGVDTLHGIHAVPAFAQPICVDAHLSHDEALAPAAALLSDLVIRAGEFAGVGIVLALIAAHWMSAPVQRLAAAARALEEGNFTGPIPAAGPSEIRALATAFAAMARALGEQMTQEQRARHDAEAANHAKDEFLAVLSHELRTPLTSTLGWTRLLRRGGVQSPHANRAITAIERSTQMQKRLIEDLLDVSRIIAGRLHLDRVSVRISDPVRTAVEELRPIAEDKGIAIESVFESVPSLTADPLRVRQIVTNLLANAIKFTPPAGRVTVRVREVDGDAEITVRDTGIGISPEFLPHVFEPFRQADAGPRRAYGGLGLGLSIVHHLVKLHGGAIEATSQGAGTGATFVVRLPLPNADASRATGPSRSTGADPIPNGGGAQATRLDNLRVLIVDDDDATRQVVAALLEDAGAKVDGVATAAEGHQRLSTHRYSAIISDLAMPQEDGYSFIRAVRTSKASVPALALTGLTRHEDAAAAYAAGFQMCLTKPIDRDKLITAIAELTLRKTA
jgi:signal transduction histidine kinase/ActR/RegA family two-component response regulator